jgi:hypothetical protein
MKSKLDEFISRNRKRNAHLYENNLILGVDYLICPVSNERLSMIKSSYIEKVLQMSVEEYDKTYPNVRGVCKKRIENIKTGLLKLDESGLTKHQISTIKAKESLSKIDSTGVSGYKKKGQKTRQTHMNNIDEFGRNGYSLLATKAIIKGNTTKAEQGQITFENTRAEFYRYKLIVTYLTEKFRKELTTGYITGLAGKDNAWHIDHQFSILNGYQQKVSPCVIGHKNNLKMIPWKDNISKHSKCSIDLDNLLSMCNYTAKQSMLEYEKIINLILEDTCNNIPPNAAFLLERYYESTLRK